MSRVVFAVQGMTCEGCENSLRTAVGKLPGVTAVTASHSAQRIDVDFAGEPDDEAVRTAVEEAGFDFAGRR